MNPPTSYLHTVIDDHSRVASVEARDDETKEAATEVLTNAVARFAERGVKVQRVLSDNGSCYLSNLWQQTCSHLGITVKRTRPDPPQTNGFAALPSWVHQDNRHRPHSAIGKAAPITRLDNRLGITPRTGHHTQGTFSRPRTVWSAVFPTWPRSWRIQVWAPVG